jgi:hypothetical protein
VGEVKILGIKVQGFKMAVGVCWGCAVQGVFMEWGGGVLTSLGAYGQWPQSEWQLGMKVAAVC